MTPQLEKAIAYLTCKECNGEGTLESRRPDSLASVGHVRIVHACGYCQGTGMAQHRGNRA
jgi:DnaJ-class molecular chaperone